MFCIQFCILLSLHSLHAIVYNAAFNSFTFVHTVVVAVVVVVVVVIVVADLYEVFTTLHRHPS